MVIFHSYVNVYQRVSNSPLFSGEILHVFLELRRSTASSCIEAWRIRLGGPGHAEILFSASCRNGGFSWEKRGKTMENHGKNMETTTTNGGFGGKIVEKSYMNFEWEDSSSYWGDICLTIAGID